MFKTTSKNNALKSVTVTIIGNVVEKSKVYKRPWSSVKEYTLIKDDSEKVYDLLGEGDLKAKNKVKEFSI